MKANIYICLITCFLFFQNIFYSNGQTVLTLQPGSTDGIDAPLISINPDGNYGDDPGFLACAWTFEGEFGIDRSLLKFNLSQISSSATIIDAKLSLYYWQGPATGHGGENASYLQKVVENWDEMTVTWNNQPGTTTTDEVTLPTSVSQTEDYPDIDITRFVSDWVVNPQNNFGMLFRIADESIYRSMLFASSDNPASSLRPKLVITYRLCPVPVADFSYIVEDPSVLFHDSSSSANTWFWDFGDGYFSDLKNPVHNYAQFGKYYTCLSITDSCGSAQFCDTVYFCHPPNPHFSYSVDWHFVNFTDSSNSPVSWFWNFGDNFFSDLQNPSHYYKNPGTYYVCLTSANSCNQQTFCDSVVFQPNGMKAINRTDVKIYPIPASDYLIMEWINPKPCVGEIQIMNSQGSMITRKEINMTPGNYQSTMDISKLSSGFYILRVTTGSVTFLKRFIVSKSF